MRYTDEDIEFANLILTDRENLDDAKVDEWMNDPEHVRLLKEFATVYQNQKHVDFELEKRNEFARLEQAIYERKSRRMTLRWSVAASIILLIGVCILHVVNNVHDINVVRHTNIVKPGEVNVELILANGESISLGKGNRIVESDIESGIYSDSLHRMSYLGATVKSQDEGREINNVLKIPVGGFYQLELADGTKVWLNSLTELRYPVIFTGEERRVHLSGEAYFEVARDSLHSFVVEAEGVNVQVYGTKFNVSTYHEGIVQTTLISGSVGVRVVETGEEVILQPDDMAEFLSSSSTIQIRKVDPFIYSAWKDGKFVFEEESIELIMERLSRWYGVEVFYENDSVKYQKFNGVITRFSDVRDVLHLIEETATVQFMIKDNVVIVK